MREIKKEDNKRPIYVSSSNQIPTVNNCSK